MMIVLLLLCSIVCNSVGSIGCKSSTQLLISLENPNAHSQPASQLPEKVESESDYKHENNYFFIQHLIAFIPVHSPELYWQSHFDTFCFRGSISGIPLFLSKRSLVI